VRCGWVKRWTQTGNPKLMKIIKKEAKRAPAKKAANK